MDMLQLLLHLWGDYILQSDWMAQNKRTSSWAAFTHALFYSVPFAVLIYFTSRSLTALVIISGTHFAMDRFGLARYVVWAKNWVGQTKHESTTVEQPLLGSIRSTTRVEVTRPNLPWTECSANGNLPSCPPWLGTWLTIVADNTIHLTINFIALKYL